MTSARTLPVVRKAVCYILRRGHVLVFEHTDFPDAGLQVPAGTLQPGEEADAAALREATEETGLQNLHIAARLGTAMFDARSIGEQEWHERHFFRLNLTQPAPDRWCHAERDGPGGAPIRFDFSWLPVNEAGTRLTAAQSALLHTLGSAQA